MKLSHKMGKIFSREAHLRGPRQLERKLHPLPVRRLLAQADPARLHEIQSRYETSTDDVEKYRKYLAAVERWLEVNAHHAQELQVHRSRTLAILDIGCGG